MDTQRISNLDESGCNPRRYCHTSKYPEVIRGKGFKHIRSTEIQRSQPSDPNAHSIIRWHYWVLFLRDKEKRSEVPYWKGLYHRRGWDNGRIFPECDLHWSLKIRVLRGMRYILQLGQNYRNQLKLPNIHGNLILGVNSSQITYRSLASFNSGRIIV